MNLLIVSPGRRVEIVNAFQYSLSQIGGKVFTADMSSQAPALYFSDEYFVMRKEFSDLSGYVRDIIKYCKEYNIKWLCTLIDPELELFSKFRHDFENNGINLIMSNAQFINQTFDKWAFYEFYSDKLNLITTFLSKSKLKSSILLGDLSYPLLAKDRFGSGSGGLYTINSEDELNELDLPEGQYIYQPKVNMTEFGVDAYFDMYTSEMTDFFIKEKITLRSGETDKSISIHDERIFTELKKIDAIDGIKGPVDIDMFDVNGVIYVNEINPRFGGGYFHSHHCGVDFIKNIINNMKGEINLVQKPFKYEENMLMLKYNNFKFIKLDN